MIRPPKLHRIMHSSFPTSRQNLIETMMWYDVITTSHCLCFNGRWMMLSLFSFSLSVLHTQLLATKTAIFFKAARETFWARLFLDLLFLLEVVVSFKLNPSGWPVRMQLKRSHNIMEAKTGLESIVNTLLNSTVWFISKETSFPSRYKRNVDINSDQVTEEPCGER